MPFALAFFDGAVGRVVDVGGFSRASSSLPCRAWKRGNYQLSGSANITSSNGFMHAIRVAFFDGAVGSVLNVGVFPSASSLLPRRVWERGKDHIQLYMHQVLNEKVDNFLFLFK